ncbi:MAG: hypothetical protein JHD05_06295 [Thermoleophilia bacterium]|nr:hypothetical protein [Thermoleophilia bacterium]
MRVFGIIVGALIALCGIAPVLAGVGIVGYLKDGTGLEIPIKGFEAPKRAVAIVSPTFSLDTSDLPSEVSDSAILLTITPPPGEGPLFIGLGPATAVNRYLRRASIARVEQTDEGASADGSATAPSPQDALQEGVPVRLVLDPGPRTSVPPPATRKFWTRTVTNDSGEITLTAADLQGTDLRVVVMRADGKPGIAADASLRFRIPILVTIGWVSLITGLVTIAIGVGLILLIVLRKQKPPVVTTDDTTPDADAPVPAAPAAATPAVAEPATTPAAEPRPAVDTAFPTAPDDNAPTQ